ncbi:MAG: hypothetical protein ACLPYS_04770 [Vulcanimicrobiaceae bacterium]|jgi:hypothetical protein
MTQQPRYSPLSPGGLAFAFAVLALLAALAMGMPTMLGMGSIMWGAHDAGGYGHMGTASFGLVGLAWMIATGALGGAMAAWIYNAFVGERFTDRTDAPGEIHTPPSVRP